MSFALTSQALEQTVAPPAHAATQGISFGGAPALKKRVENAVLIFVPLLGAIITPFWFWRHPFGAIELIAFLVSYVIVGFGVGIGLHRYFSHRSFRAPPGFSVALGIAGSMAFQGSVLRWVADHRRHHAATDRDGDLHSPVVDCHGRSLSPAWGLFHAHFGWMFDESVTRYEIYAKDLLADRQIMFLHRTQWLWPSLLLGSLWSFGFAFGGIEHAWGCLLFAGCLRTSLFHNVIWAVNSVGHAFGHQTYKVKNTSRNNFALALLTFGEGWHNNHHRFPRSAFHGLKADEIDISGKIITGLERLGVINEVVRVPPAQLAQS